MTSNQFFTELRKIYFLFLGSSIIAILAAVYFKGSLITEMDEETLFIFKFIPFVVGLSTIGLSFILFKVMTGKSGVESELSKKLDIYRNAVIIRSALLEGAALMFAVFYALISLEVLLIIAAALAGILFYLKPTPENFKNTLELTPTEESKIDTGDVEVMA